MIVLPIIGVITAGQVGFWALGGAISAAFGVLVRKYFKLSKTAADQEERIHKLEVGE